MKDNIIENLRKRILCGVNTFVYEHFYPNPFNYLYERDIQSHLFTILRNEVRNEVFRHVPIKRDVFKNISTRETFNLGLIYSEYSQRKIDLVCLDPTNKKDFENYKLYFPKNINTDPLWDQPLLVGIELKYIQCGYFNKYGFDICLKDRKKLEKYKNEIANRIRNNNKFAPNFQYLMLCFVQEDEGIYKLFKDDQFEENKHKKIDYVEEYNCIYLIGSSSMHKYM